MRFNCSPHIVCAFVKLAVASTVNSVLFLYFFLLTRASVSFMQIKDALPRTCLAFGFSKRKDRKTAVIEFTIANDTLLHSYHVTILMMMSPHFH